MSNQEIITKAIEQAIANGWMPSFKMIIREIEFKNDNKLEFNVNLRDYSDEVTLSRYFTIEQIIFNHDFAKALWGNNLNQTEQVHCWWNGAITRAYLKNWQLHLQQMVIASDPIKYIGDNLD